MVQILKVCKIKNVGQIKNYTASGDVAFRKFNTIYGENAVGKTTLSTIFRSLKTGDTTAISLKKTLGVPEPVVQEVEIKINSGTGTVDQTFSYSQTTGWGNHRIPEIEIFDAYFVEKNILSGWQCSTEQQKNLPALILGEEGIAQVVQLEKYRKELNETIPSLENSLKNKILGLNPAFNGWPSWNTKADEFLKKFYEMRKPPEGYDYDKKITDTANNIKILQALVNNPNCQPFKMVSIPDFDKNYFVNNVLHKTLESLSKEAEAKVKQQAKKFGMTNAAWLVQGRQLLSEGDDCPFCGQSVFGLDLVNAYKAYFSEQYNNFSNELKSYNGFLVFEESIISEIINTIKYNLEIRKAFGGGITDDWPEIKTDEFKVLSARLHTMLKEAHDKKKASVLDSIDLPEEFIELFSRFEVIATQLLEYNVAIKTTNDKLSALDPNNLEKEQQKLLIIKLTMSRYLELNELTETEVKPLVDKRATITSDNRTLQEAFHANAVTFKNTYEASINDFLEKFGANFRLQFSVNLRTARPSYDFGVIIDGCTGSAIPARPRTSVDVDQCMGNSLSEGDKTTLAFAFFLAKLNRDATTLSNKIVMIDDPISSLDKHRKTRTMSIITGLVSQVSQLFVISHDEFFLKECFTHKSLGNGSEKNSLQLKKYPDSARIIPCDLIDLTKSGYSRNYDVLVDYTNNPANYDKQGMPNRIRAYLEGLLRRLYPHEFRSGETLGNYVGQIGRMPGHKLSRILSELNFLNDFGNGGSHDSNQPTITDTETMTAVNCALGIMDSLITSAESKKKNQEMAVTTPMDIPLKGWK